MNRKERRTKAAEARPQAKKDRRTRDSNIDAVANAARIAARELIAQNAGVGYSTLGYGGSVCGAVLVILNPTLVDPVLDFVRELQAPERRTERVVMDVGQEGASADQRDAVIMAAVAFIDGDRGADLLEKLGTAVQHLGTGFDAEPER